MTEAREWSDDDNVAPRLGVDCEVVPAEMDHLRDIDDGYDLAVVEDAAQGHGAEYDGQRVGSLGGAACFSFSPTKNTTTGERGMITADRTLSLPVHPNVSEADRRTIAAAITEYES